MFKSIKTQGVRQRHACLPCGNGAWGSSKGRVFRIEAPCLPTHFLISDNSDDGGGGDDASVGDTAIPSERKAWAIPTSRSSKQAVAVVGDNT